MPSMLVTAKISKGFKVWTDMAKSLEKEAGEQGAKVIWAGTNPDETSIYKQNKDKEHQKQGT